MHYHIVFNRSTSFNLLDEEHKSKKVWQNSYYLKRNTNQKGIYRCTTLNIPVEVLKKDHEYWVRMEVIFHNCVQELIQFENPFHTGWDEIWNAEEIKS